MSEEIKPAIYFPYIHFQNLNWLKSAALLYDQIHRVIPDHYPRHDERVVKALSQETDLLEIHNPTSAEAEIIGARFIRACESGTVDKLALRGDRIAHIHTDKISITLRQYLHEQNLTWRQTRGQEWIAMSDKTAAVYMGFLANEYAKQMRGSVVSDENRMIQALNVIQAEAFGPRNTPTDQILCATFRRLKLRTPGQIEIGKIIKFRNRFNAERRRFFHEVDSLAKEIPRFGREGIDPFLREKSRLLEEALMDLQKGAQSIGITTVIGACSGLFSTMLRGNVDSPHLISSVLGSSGASLLLSAIYQYKKQRGSPVAYLDRIQRSAMFAPR